MSISVDYEEVAKDLAIKVANLELQLSTYKNVLTQMEKEKNEPSKPSNTETSPIPASSLEGDGDE